MICRNFSANDGMFPGQRPGQRNSNGIVQGLPVAIGTGRRSNRSSGASFETTPMSPADRRSSCSTSDGMSSGGDSPKSLDGGFDHQIRQVTQHMPKPISRLPKVDEYVCYCGRGAVHAYGRCGYCLRDSGWA